MLDENVDQSVLISTLGHILTDFQQEMNTSFQTQMQQTLQEKIRKNMLIYGVGTARTTEVGDTTHDLPINHGVGPIDRIPLRVNVREQGKAPDR